MKSVIRVSNTIYGYIYITENLINGKRYIGQHKSTSFDSSYKGSGKVIKRAIEKYGWDNFKTEILEWCDSRDYLNEREIYWINKFGAVENDNFYNILSCGYGGPGYMPGHLNPMYGRFGELNPMYGKHHTEESIQKMKLNRRDMSGENNPMYGRHHTEESREKNRIAHLGKKMGEEFSLALSERVKGELNPMYGKHHTDEAKEKIRQVHLGMHHSEEVRKKMSDSRKGEKHWNYGKHHSEETKRKMSLAHSGKCMSDALREQMSIDRKGKPNVAIRKKVQCIETGQIFDCAKDVCTAFNKSENSRHNVTRCARSYDNGIDDIAFGYHWRFV